MSRTEKLLFQLTIFLIPTNLAYHWVTSDSYLNGILVDYLIPKAYLSDIPILILLLLWLFKSISKLSRKKVRINLSKKRLKSYIPLVLYFVLFLKGLLSSNPIAATWLWIKLTQFSLFYFWIKTHYFKGKSHTLLRDVLIAPLVASMVFQSIVGLYQVLFQKSLAGYWLFGETTLTLSSQIDKVHLGELIPHLGISLLIPAYGTTPHNNVLAGFLAIGIVSIFILTRGIKKMKLYQKLTLYITYSLSLLTLILTFSGSAWVSLALAFSLIGLRHTPSKRLPRLLVLSTGVIITFITIFPIRTDNPSLLRRQQLNHISIDMFKDHPLTGVGLNNFTTHMSDYGSISSNTRFLQPTHNIFLLWLAETGLAGSILLVLIIYKISSFSAKYSSDNIILPMILIIGLLDHYLLTIQTGQLLLVLSATHNLYNHKYGK